MKIKSTSLLVNSAVLTGLVLAIPLIAMQFTTEVDWELGDFVIMGILLFGTASLFQWATKKAGKNGLWVGIGIILALFYIWAELAVGIFTNLGN